MSDITLVAEGLKFPEGPVAMLDGSVLVMEIARGTLSRVRNGEITVVADLGGGPWRWTQWGGPRSRRPLLCL